MPREPYPASFSAWYALGLIGFWVFGYEPKGRTFDDIDETLATPAARATVRATGGVTRRPGDFSPPETKLTSQLPYSARHVRR